MISILTLNNYENYFVNLNAFKLKNYIIFTLLFLVIYTSGFTQNTQIKKLIHFEEFWEFEHLLEVNKDIDKIIIDISYSSNNLTADIISTLSKTLDIDNNKCFLELYNYYNPEMKYYTSQGNIIYKSLNNLLSKGPQKFTWVSKIEFNIKIKSKCKVIIKIIKNTPEKPVKEIYFGIENHTKKPSLIIKSITSYNLFNLQKIRAFNCSENLDEENFGIYIDGQQVEDMIITKRGLGQIQLYSTKTLLANLDPGAHIINIIKNPDKIREKFQHNIIDKFIIWLEKGELKDFTEDLWKAKNYALIIGVGNYKNSDFNLKDLPTAQKQARQLGQFLEGLGFEVKYFVDDEIEIKKNMIEKYIFEVLDPKLDFKKDRVFFYYGGHGITHCNSNGDTTGYLLLSSSNKDNFKYTSISVIHDIVWRYTDLLNAKHIFYAIDACVASKGIKLRSESISLDDEFKNLYRLKIKTDKRGAIIITAGTDNQPAIDVNGGIFTKALLKGLKGEADFHKDGVIDLDELFDYVHDEVSVNAIKKRFEQIPYRMKIPLNCGQLVFFYRNRNPFR